MGRLGAGLDANERQKPVGSLFLEAMDRDTIRPRVRRTAQRRLADCSLPNTPLAMCPDDPQRTQLFATRGRRRVDVRAGGDIFAPPDTPTRRQPRVAPQAASHLNSAVQAKSEEQPAHFSRQRCRPPPFDAGTSKSPRPHALVPPSPLRRSHLQLGSLEPKREKEKERPVPPPMIKKPLHYGRRHIPERRAVSADSRRVGIKMVQPLPQWRGAAERHLAFSNFGVDVYEPKYIRHRNQSNWSIGFNIPPTPLKRSLSAAEGGEEGRVADNGTTPDGKVMGRGRRYSSAPRQRNFDIISWTPR